MDCHQRTCELMNKKNQGASLLFSYFYFISFSFFLFSFSLSSFFFSYFSFLLIIIFFHFFFCSSELLQHNTYIAFVRDDVMNPSPCLNDARPGAQKRGEMTAKGNINYIIAQNI
jgi:hypothetical protein